MDWMVQALIVWCVGWLGMGWLVNVNPLWILLPVVLGGAFIKPGRNRMKMFFVMLIIQGLLPPLTSLAWGGISQLGSTWIADNRLRVDITLTAILLSLVTIVLVIFFAIVSLIMAVVAVDPD